MGGPYKRKKYHYGDTHLKKSWRTKRRTKDLDQVSLQKSFSRHVWKNFSSQNSWMNFYFIWLFKIDTDLVPDNVEKLLNQDVDFDKPGLAQFYCVHCSKHFINERAFSDHIKGKPHKRRLHALKTEPYTIEESERAAGVWICRELKKVAAKKLVKLNKSISRNFSWIIFIMNIFFIIMQEWEVMWHQKNEKWKLWFQKVWKNRKTSLKK